MRYWLVKSEPDVFSIDDLARCKKTLWDGVRNYQARNYLREMEPGDKVVLYHSNAPVPGAAGVCTVSKKAVPDPLQFEKGSEYFDEKSSVTAPRWFSPELAFEERFKEILPLETMKTMGAMGESPLTRRGNRLSVIPLTGREFQAIYKAAT